MSSIGSLGEYNEDFSIPAYHPLDDEVANLKLLQELLTAYANDEYIKLSSLLDDLYPQIMKSFEIDDINDSEEVLSKTHQLETVQQEFNELKIALLLLSNSPYEAIDQCTLHIESVDDPDNYLLMRALAYFETNQDALALADFQQADLDDEQKVKLIALLSKLGIVTEVPDNTDDLTQELAAFVKGDYSEAKQLAKKISFFDSPGGDFDILLMIHCVENRK